MRFEHRQIAARLEALHEKVRRRDPDSDPEEATLLEALSLHNLKEENVLYPALDRLLSADEVAAVFDDMAKVPEEAYRTCCGRPA
jgi:hemerythrin-like domain-containing protein